MGKLIPLDPQSPEPFVFENKVTGGRIPTRVHPVGREGLPRIAAQGPVAGYEVIGVHMRLEDGSYHDVDSSTMAFEICARDCFRETFKKADPVLLEPIMKVEVEIPTEFQGPVTGAHLLEARRDPRHRVARRATRSSPPKCRSPRCSATPTTCEA